MDKISDHSTIRIDSKMFSKPIDKNIYVKKIFGYNRDKLVHNLSVHNWNNLGSKTLCEKAEILNERVKNVMGSVNLLSRRRLQYHMT